MCQGQLKMMCHQGHGHSQAEQQQQQLVVEDQNLLLCWLEVVQVVEDLALVVSVLMQW